jgi:hypothetical protein
VGHDPDKSRRVRRFYQRYFTGVGVGSRLRILTLTTSDEALALGLDIHESFRTLVMRLTRRYRRFEYIGIKEPKGDRVHLHLVFRGEYMAQELISALWQDIDKNEIVYIQAVYGSRGGARYLAKYLAKRFIIATGLAITGSFGVGSAGLKELSVRSVSSPRKDCYSRLLG